MWQYICYITLYFSLEFFPSLVESCIGDYVVLSELFELLNISLVQSHLWEFLFKQVSTIPCGPHERSVTCLGQNRRVCTLYNTDLNSPLVCPFKCKWLSARCAVTVCCQRPRRLQLPWQLLSAYLCETWLPVKTQLYHKISQKRRHPHIYSGSNMSILNGKLLALCHFNFFVCFICRLRCCWLWLWLFMLQ